MNDLRGLVENSQPIRQSLFVTGWTFWTLTLFGAIALLWPAIYNGYPPLYYDSAGYVHDWTHHIRAIGYNLFLRITSLNISLWFAVFTQAFLTSYLMMRTAVIVPSVVEKRLPEPLNQPAQVWAAFGILLSVLLLTSISKYTSWLMPDIFTSWIFFGCFLFLAGPSRQDRIIAGAILFLSFFSHLSHIPLTIAFLSFLAIVLFCFPQLRAITERRRFLELSVLFLITLLSICSFNYLHKGFFALSHQGSANFLVSHMISWGVVQKVLKEECPSKRWRLCEFQHVLDAQAGKRHDWFLWKRKSPLAKVGGWTDQSEQKEIVRFALRNHLAELARFAVRDGWRQFISWQPRDSFLPSKQRMRGGGYDLHYLPIEKQYPLDAGMLDRSKQSAGTFRLPLLIPFEIRFAIGWILGLGTIFLFVYKRQWAFLMLIGSSITFIVFNAFVTGALSGVAARKQARVAWIVLYCVLTSLSAYLLESRARVMTSTEARPPKQS